MKVRQDLIKKWFKSEFGASLSGSVDGAGRPGRAPMGGASSHTPAEIHKKLTAAGFKKGQPIKAIGKDKVMGNRYTKPSKSGEHTHYVELIHDGEGKVTRTLRPDTAHGKNMYSEQFAEASLYETVEVHGDPDDDSYDAIDKIHAHIKAAGHTIHHDDDGKATKDPHVTAHYESGEDRKTSSPSGFTIHPKAQSDKKLMTMVKSFHKKYGE